MEIINLILGTPLGYVMYWCYQLLGSYGWAIILFTIITKIILFPLSLIAQKNSIKMVKMTPLLEEIKHRNAGNGELIIQEQKALYKKEKYSSFIGILPLLIQIPIILGLINVIYNPLEHLFHFDATTIQLLIDQAAQVLGMTRDQMGFSAQLFALEAVKSDPTAFSSIPNTTDEITRLLAFDTHFLGIDLSAVPKFTSITVLVPLASGLSALALGVYQNKYNVLQVEQGFIGKWGMVIFLVAFSAYFAYVLPCGLGLYWTAGNLLSIPVLWLCNLVYDPKKYIDYDNRFVKPKLTKEEKAEKKSEEKALQKRSKKCMKELYAKDNKRELLFYSEAQGFYKYFKGIITYVLEHSDITVHYVTSDPDDNIFKTSNPQLKTYFVSNKDLISFFMKLDADIVAMTMPDLDVFHIKRSLVRDDVEYVYIDHGMTSFHLMLREHALDHFDTIFAYGPNHIEEVRQTEEAYNLPKKTIVKTGFALLDELIVHVEELEKTLHVLDEEGQRSDESAGNTNKKPQILIAPSWQKDNILEKGIDELLEYLLAGEYRIIIRPHPEYVKRFGAQMDALIERYQSKFSEDFVVELDFSSNVTVYTSDVIITDWSSIAQEFSYATKRPSLFINTPMKIMNPEYKRIAAVPLDISLRDEIGVSVELDELERVPGVINEFVDNKTAWSDQITAVVEENIYDIGHGEVGGGTYLISRIAYQRQLSSWRLGQTDATLTVEDDSSNIEVSQEDTGSLTTQHKEEPEGCA